MFKVQVFRRNIPEVFLVAHIKNKNDLLINVYEDGLLLIDITDSDGKLHQLSGAFDVYVFSVTQT